MGVSIMADVPADDLPENIVPASDLPGSSSVPSRSTEKPKKPSLAERGKEVAEQTGMGAAFGLASPYILTGLGYGAAAFPLTAPAAPWLLGAGAAAKGARVANIGYGAFSGATGETSGQAAEMMGASKPTAEAARFVGGMVSPEFVRTIGALINFGGRKLLGMGTESAIRSVMKDLNLNDKEISPSQKEFIKKQIDALRGGQPSDVSQKSMYDIMATGASDITSEAEKLAAATRQKGGAELSEAQRRSEKMRGSIPKIEESAQKIIIDAQAQRSNIGVERENSDIGKQIRDKIFDLFSTGMKQRSKEYLDQQKIRDDVVSAKEAAGNFVQKLPEYESLLKDLREKLLIGKAAQKQKTAPVTEKGVLQAYQNIYDAVTSRKVAIGINSDGNPVYKTFPTSFQALDDVRRRLGDTAFGKEVEGYSAIGTTIAEKYYKTISNIQSKFAGEAHDKLQGDYEIASRLLDKFKSKAGQKVTALDRFDPTRYKTDPASITNDFFKTKQSVSDLLELTGNDLSFVLKSASDHVARELKNKDATGIKNWIDKNSDWLKALPEVDGKVSSYLKTLEAAEKTFKKTIEASRKLKTKEPGVLRAGESLATASETEAEKITGNAAKRVKVILGDKFAAQRVKDLILSGSKSQWGEVIPILVKSPEGKKVLGEAVTQVMASRAETGLRTAPEFFRDNVRPALESSNLVPKAQLDSIQSTLETIKNSTLPDELKMTLGQRLLRNALTGYLLPAVGRADKSSDDVINGRKNVTSPASVF